MRLILPACLIAIAGLPAFAQGNCKLQGKVTTADGKPVAKAVITIKRTDISWKKTVTTNNDGSWMQVGLEPKVFQVECEAPGFAKRVMPPQKVNMEEKNECNIVLLTPEQAAAAAAQVGQGVAQEDPSAAAANAATSSYNNAVALFNQRKFAEALPGLEKARAAMQESFDKSKDDKTKAEITTRIEKMDQVYALALFEVGNAATDEAERKAMFEKAEPILVNLAKKDPKDSNYPLALARIAEVKGDNEAAKKYQETVDALVGPNPDRIYNQATDQFNKGDMAAAKATLQKILAINPNYPEYYYLMAMIEYGNSNLPATKANFKKYLELAPNGRKAAEVKELLATDPSLKAIK